MTQPLVCCAGGHGPVTRSPRPASARGAFRAMLGGRYPPASDCSFPAAPRRSRDPHARRAGAGDRGSQSTRRVGGPGARGRREQRHAATIERARAARAAAPTRSWSCPVLQKPTQGGLQALPGRRRGDGRRSRGPVNVPGRTASNIAAATALSWHARRKHRRSKRGLGDLAQIRPFCADRPPGFPRAPGDDAMTCADRSGRRRLISVASNEAPDLMAKPPQRARRPVGTRPASCTTACSH